MLRQVKLLTVLGLCNLCGFNEARYSKDPAKRKRLLGMGFVYLFVLLVFWGYLALLSAGLLYLGVGEVIPCYLYLIACMVIFCFSFFKAADVIFQKGTYELLISLPVSQSSIVISRFLTMYITNLLFSFAVVLPGSIMYGVFLHPSPGFYIRMLLGTLFLPAIPLVTAMALSSVIFAVSAGMRHKNLVSIAMPLGLVLAAIVFCFGAGETAAVIETFELSAFRSLAVLMTEQIKKIYPPAGWFGSAVTEGSLPQGILLVCIPLLYTVFLSIAGLSVNLKFPLFQWKSEVQVVKQSASVLAAMLTDLVFTLIPIVLLLMFPGQQNLLNVSAAVMVLAASVILYRKALCGTQNELIG